MKFSRATILLLVLYSLIFLTCTRQKPESVEKTSNANEKEVLLVGTFHYHNPGADVVKTKSFDVLNENTQKDLDSLTAKIKAYSPNKIFVEWNYAEQKELDSLYQLYRKGIYFDNPDLSNFYLKNEIFQLAFRVANALNLDRVYAVDYPNTDFPFDSLMTVIADTGQQALQNKIENAIQTFREGFDHQIESGVSIIDLTAYLNSPELNELSNEVHCEIPLLAGPADNFIGAYLTSEWYKRNLYMWSLMEKYTNDEDQRIMALLGSSHTAMIKKFVDANPRWKAVGFQEIL